MNIVSTHSARGFVEGKDGTGLAPFGFTGQSDLRILGLRILDQAVLLIIINSVMTLPRSALHK